MNEEKIHALIVDDDSKFLEIMKRSLESKNCVVECTTEPYTALSLLINKVFHIAFIDCVLQEGQGVQLAQKIRNILGHSVEIVMMSGVFPEKSLSNYTDMGIYTFLPKPVSNKDVEENITQIREKVFHGNQKNILIKLFKNNTNKIKKLKFLANLKHSNSYEFFLYLYSLIDSKEALNINFTIDNKNHTIICAKGEVTDYESDRSEDFLNKLLSNKLITKEEVEQFKGQDYKECIDNLLDDCILSSRQITDTKYDLLIDILKSINTKTKVSFSIDFTLSKKETTPLLSLNQYTDLVLLLLKQNFNGSLISLFDEEVMKQSLNFEEGAENSLPEAKEFLSELKKGMKLKGIYNKYINDKNSFCYYILHILLKGNVYFSTDSRSDFQYAHLYKRYESLEKFVKNTKNPEDFFSYLTKSPKDRQISITEIKNLYLQFIKHNHPDKLSLNVPKELTALIEDFLTQMQNIYQSATDLNYKENLAKTQKEKDIQKQILYSENKKICERYLEEAKYAEAFSIIKSIPEEYILKNVYWQCLYLWLYFTYQHESITEKTAHKYMKNIQAQSRETEVAKERLYYYVLGLYHENKNNYKQATQSYEKTKSLDPSFQPVYKNIHKLSLKKIREKQNKQSLLSEKLKAYLKNSMNKKKKAG